MSHIHAGVDCPGKDPDQMNELATKFSHDNLSNKSVKLLDVFVDQSCMLQSKKEHLCLFVVDADSSSVLLELFEPMHVEVRPMIRWQNFPSKPQEQQQN